MRALGGAFLAAGCIESFEHGMKKLALPMDINATTIDPFIAMLLILSRRKVEVMVVAGRLIGLHGIASDIRDKEAGNCECVIADHFCRETKA